MLCHHFEDGRAEALGIDGFDEAMKELRGIRPLRSLFEEAKSEEITIDEVQVETRPRKPSGGASSIFATAHKKADTKAS